MTNPQTTPRNDLGRLARRGRSLQAQAIHATIQHVLRRFGLGTRHGMSRAARNSWADSDRVSLTSGHMPCQAPRCA